MGFDVAAIHYPLPGRDPMGSLYYSLIKSVNECILKNRIVENGDKEDGNLGAGEVVMDEEGDEEKKQEGAQEEAVKGNGQEELDGDERMQEEKEGGHVDAVMED